MKRFKFSTIAVLLGTLLFTAPSYAGITGNDPEPKFMRSLPNITGIIFLQIVSLFAGV